MKYIPRKSRVKSEVYKGFTVLDICVAAVGVVLSVLIFTSNIPYNIYIGLSFLSFWCMLFVPIADDVKLYFSVVLMFKFMAYKKKYYKNPKSPNDDIKRIIPFTGLNTDKYINFGEYYGMVIEITPVELFLMDETKQEMMINTFAQCFQRLNKNQKVTIIKTKKPMILDDLVNFEDDKYNVLIDMAERGLYSEEELDARSPVFEERLRAINYLNNDAKILKNHFYMVVYDTDREALESTVNGVVASLMSTQTPLYSDVLLGDKLLIFLRSTFNEKFDERELENLSLDDKVKWAYPSSLKFGINNTIIDDVKYRTFTITDYPIEVPNAWMYPLFMLDQTRVVVNIQPIEKYKAEKMLDKSLMEMEIRLGKDAKSSKKIENQTQYDTLRELLTGLKNNNENLFDVNVHITAEESMKKEVRAVLRQNGFKFAENFGRQVDAFVSANISRLDTLQQYVRGIQTSAISAMFPFISSSLQDRRGFYMGYGREYPVFIDFFVRNNERVNSNMIIIGKSGAGKSFATKTLLTNFAADNTRVFIIDPENEYEVLCHNLRGKIIDVGSSSDGIFNPFHIFTSLEADEGGEDDSFNAHLQFLEQFFKVILEGINTDAFETLNSMIIDLYRKKGIDNRTNISKVKAEQFPIFDDLLKMINERLSTEKEPYTIRNLQTAKVYIEKFASGGRNSNLWNGPSSIVTNENFICFSFRSLISNGNDLIANAQMLLVFKYLNNEISKNRDFNLKYFADAEEEEDHRRVIVCVDEAHVFINKKFPIALDFMKQMAKRIRKYFGMQMVITQNIKDFVGTPEIAAQSTAIINASQYSLILSLAPNDMTDMIQLYQNAGGINQEEQDNIITAKRGQIFLITSATNRTTVQLEALSTVKDLFEKKSEE